MTHRRAASYTLKAFLTFLAIGIPALVLQASATWIVAEWRYGDSPGGISAQTLGWISVVENLSGLWIQFAVIFVIFKYAPEVIVEYQESRIKQTPVGDFTNDPDLEQ